MEYLLGHFPASEQHILRLRWGLYDGAPSNRKDKLTIGQIAKHCRSSYDKIRKLESRAVDLVREGQHGLHSLFHAASPSSSSSHASPLNHLLVAAA